MIMNNVVEKSGKLSMKKNMIIFGIGIFFTKLLNFIFAPIYSHFMTTAQFGIIDILQTTGFLLIPICTLAITEAVLKYGIDDNADSKKVFSTGLFVTLIGLLLISVVVVVAGQFIYKEYLWLTLVYYLCECCFLFLQAFSKSLKKTTDFVISSVIYSVISISLISVFLVVQSLGVYGYLIGLASGGALGSLYLIIRCKVWKHFSFNSIKKDCLKTMISFSAPLTLSGIAYWLISGSDKYITRLLMGESATGLLSVVHKIPSLCTVLYSIFHFAFILSALKDHKLTEKTYEEDKVFYNSIFRHVLTLLIFGSIFVTLLAEPIILLYSKDFYISWIFVPLYAFGVILGALRNFYASIYMTKEKTFKIMIIVVIGALINIIVCFLLMKFTNLGLWATAISTVCANGFIFLFYCIDVRKIVDIKPKWNEIVSMGICLIVSVLSVLSLSRLVYYLIVGTSLVVLAIINLKNLLNILKLVLNKRNKKDEKIS